MVSQRLKELRKSFKMTQRTFGARIGAKQGNVADWERGRSNPGLESLNNIVKHFNVNLNWLLTGEGVMFVPNISDEAHQRELKQKVVNLVRNELSVIENDGIDYYPSEKGDYWYLPLTGEILAGNPIPHKFKSEPLTYVPIAKCQLRNPFVCEAFRVNGDSMEPKIEHSDIVVLRRESDPYECHDKVVAVKTPEGMFLKKHAIDVVKGSSCLTHFNSKYPTEFLEEDWDLLGHIVLIVRHC